MKYELPSSAGAGIRKIAVHWFTEILRLASELGKWGKLAMSLPKFFAATLVLYFAACVAMAQSPQRPDIPAQYAATAVGQSGPVAGKTFNVTIYVTGVTTDEQVQELEATLKKSSQNGIVSTFEKTSDLGRFSPADDVGTGMRFVRITPTPGGGQHIVMATNRPISFPELYNGTRSRDYPIGIVVLDVDKDGKGSGQFSPACKIRFNKQGEFEVEHYGQKPFRLANVYRQK